MGLRYDTITFLSDYGLTDEFVGIVHSVIRSITPEATVLDLTHQIPAYDVRAGGLALARSVQYLCPGVVLAVVDPGVATERRAIAVEVGQGQSVLIGPDNGVLAPAVAMCGGATRAVVLDNADYHLPAPGATFAGRDIFAPVAAHLCAGVPFDEVGTAVDTALLLPGVLPVSHTDGDDLVAQVLWIDGYGNAQLNVDPDEIASWGDRVRLHFNDQTRTGRVVENYRDVGPHEIGLVVDSYGLLAIVLDQQSAAAQLGLGPETGVRLSAFAADEQEMGVTTAVELSSRAPRVNGEDQP
jgi:S-adenosyl-L-methionine hydrolase (adenosine-forming)